MSDQEPEEYIPKLYPDLPELPVKQMYDYECKFCGVIVSSVWIVTLPMQCPDHKVLLQMKQD